MAASNLREDVCALLLEEGSDLFFKNEYGITPIHALCNFPILEEEHLNIQNDKKAAIIARDMIRKAVSLDITKDASNEKKSGGAGTEERNKGIQLYKNSDQSLKRNIPKKGSIRYKLLYGKTIKWLGSNTPLHIAAYKGRKLLCSELIHGGTDPDVENIELATPLHLASLEGHYETVKILLKYGSGINKENYQGNTPLLLAIYGLKLETVKLLLEEGADLSLCCNTTLSFQVPRKLDDLPLISHSGYNNKDLKTYIYSMGTSHTGFGNNSSTKILSIPIHTPIAELLYISPKEMLTRVKDCFDIITFLNSAYELSPLFEQRDTNGFTPYELLNSTWNDFLRIRNEALLNQGLWYSSLSEEDKVSTEELWSHIMQRVERLLEVIRVEEKIYDINKDDPELELPVPKKEFKGIPELELKDPNEKTEFLVRKDYKEPIIVKKRFLGEYSSYDFSTQSLAIQRNIFQFKDLREVIMKKKKEYMEVISKLNPKESAKISSQGKSAPGGAKGTGLLSSRSGGTKSLGASSSSKSASMVGKSPTITGKSNQKMSSPQGMAKKPILNNKANDAPQKKLVIKNNPTTTSSLPSKTVLKAQVQMTTKAGGIGAIPKPLSPTTKLGATKVDLSKVKVATPKKIEIKTNLIQPKTVAKIVVKSKLVPKKT
ncbi:putative histone lysine methyltransferase, SET [Cryptosporidium felis]|nr:putative histone lysine methyltransferase, SET [Cryptosporidium felis]